MSVWGGGGGGRGGGECSCQPRRAPRRSAVSILLVFWLSLCARSQETASVNTASLTPSWETQRQAATYSLNIPAPRGQITDRNGVPLAQNRVSNNLSVVFPTPFEFPDRQIVEFLNLAVGLALGLTRG